MNLLIRSLNVYIAIRTVQKKDQGYFSDIILIGEDDFGIEQSFDFTSIIKNIEVAVRKNEDDRYDENEVERNFFEKIR